MSAIELYWYIEGITTAFFVGMLIYTRLRGRDAVLDVLSYNLLFWLAMHLMPVIFPVEYISDDFRTCAVINGYDMTAVPLCVFLLTELCRPGFYTIRRLLIEETPFLVIQTVYLIIDKPFIYNILVIYTVIYALVYSRLILKWIGRYNDFLAEHYSYQEGLSLRWIYLVFVVLVVLMALWVCTLTFLATYVDCAFLAVTVIGWSMICYFIYRQESILGELEPMNDGANNLTEVQQQSSEPHAADLPDIGSMIREKFLTPRLYLDHKLTLTDMAAAIGTNRTYLSRYINEELKMTFYEYVNGLRLEYAAQLLANGEQNLTQISHQAGFNSYATFRRAFVARYGVSPSKYKAQ